MWTTSGFGLAAGIAVVLTVALAGPGPARAQQIVEGMTGPLLLELLTADGQTGLVKRDSQGDPMVEASVDQVRYQVFFYDCRREEGVEPVCGSLQFSARFPTREGLTLELVNGYNTRARYVQAYLAPDRMLRLDMSVMVAGGTTRENVLNLVRQWGRALVAFEDDVYLTAAEAAR